MKSIARIDIPSTELRQEGSWGECALGMHASTMELFLYEEGNAGLIEWDIPTLDTTEHIGVWFNNERDLVSYDGVSSLPRPAIDFLRSQGYSVGREHIA